MVPADSDRISRVPPYSGGPPDALCLPVPDFHRLRSDFPDCSSSENAFLWELLLPRHCRNNIGLGSSPFDRHYSGNRDFFLFLRVLRCFRSPGWLNINMCARPSTLRVAPFGHLRINTCLRFPGAFRSLPRPSSPAEAKASSVRSCNLQFSAKIAGYT